jgi:aminomethyltransferase
LLDRCLSNDLWRIRPQQAQYTHALNDSGGVVDDLIAYVDNDDDVLLVPNAANSAEVARLLQADAPSGVGVDDRHEDFGVLAVQGPRSREVLGALGLPNDHEYMSFEWASWGPSEVRLAVLRSGYTGELGFELLVPWSETGALWDALTEAGALPCGLGARDTLRTEMGYPLHGQDLSPTITPVQARSSWAVGWDKDEFWGREAVLAERAAGPSRRLWGLRAEGRGIPRCHMNVVVPGGDGAGMPVGEVTSGTFSPTLKLGIALALLDASVEEGDVVEVDLRGRATPFTVVKPPFVESHVR